MINTSMNLDKLKPGKHNDPFFDAPEYGAMLQNIKGIMMSDGMVVTLMDFERVLDEADLFAYKNWDLGELVDGPARKRYTTTATFMWPFKLMPDPRGAKRLLTLGCNIKFKKSNIEIPMQVKSEMDFKPGTHFPKMVEKQVWLVRIEIPNELMNDVREGSIDLADQTIDLSDLDAAYALDLDDESMKSGDNAPDTFGGAPGGMGGMDMGGGLGDLGAPTGIGGLGGPANPPGGGFGL